MATATAAPSTDELLLTLAADGPTPLKALISTAGHGAAAMAWARGEIELGRTKYVITGNPATNITIHNGIELPPATVLIEGGIEWPMQSAPLDQYGSLDDVAAEELPVCPRYQKYQSEVQVNREKDVWEWLDAGAKSGGRPTRFARREIDRAEAETLFAVYARLTKKGRALLAA